jgi:hypothetical protein
MAVISTSGISALQVIKSEHILRIINALNGVVSNDITVSGSSKLKTLYAPSMVGPTSFTGTFTATHTVNNIDTFAIVGQNATNAGSGIYGYSVNGNGIYANSDSGTGLYAHSNSGPIARFTANKDHQLMKLFNNGNLLLNPLTASSEDPADTGYKLYVGGNTAITGSLVVTGSITVRNILTLTPTSSLPTGQPTGSIIVSGSGASCKPYFYNGTTWTALF